MLCRHACIGQRGTLGKTRGSRRYDPRIDLQRGKSAFVVVERLIVKQ